MDRREFLKTAGVLAAASTLAGCQTDSSTAPMAGNPFPTTVQSGSGGAKPSVTIPTTEQTKPVVNDLATLINNRLTFGVRPSEPLFSSTAGSTDDKILEDFLDRQLNPGSIDDSVFEERLQRAGFETLQKSFKDLAYEHITHNPYKNNDDRHWQWYVKPFYELIRATFLRAIYSRQQLQELLVDFWHNHFNVYGDQDDVSPLMVSYDRDVIREHVFGNFRQFLEAVATHPSMLTYLNNRTNSDAGPNENFARELLELHTMGAENYLGIQDPTSIEKDENGFVRGYIDNDVYEAARCFTGWRMNDDLWEGEEEVDDSLTFLYYQPWHDRYNKFILGQYIPADQSPQKDGRDVLDLLASHPGTATHIARKLCRRFVSDDPPQGLVERVARTFMQEKDSPEQLREVYKTLLLSQEFRESSGGKLKRPLEWAVSTIRALNVEMMQLPEGVYWTMFMMGQPLFGHHQPDGYPDKAEHWINSMSSIYGWNLITGLVENWWSDEEDGNNVRVDLLAQTPVEVSSATQLVDYWLERWQLQNLPAESRTALIQFTAGEAGVDTPLNAEELSEKIPALVTLILISPQFRYRG